MQKKLFKEKPKKPKPPIKWAGGKGQLLSQFAPHFPKKGFLKYGEPFFGGGAVFFNLQPSKAILIDSNFELINFFRVVRDDLSKLLDKLNSHVNEKEYFYSVRAINPEEISKVERASRFLYLNKTAFNGLWRVNKKGNFNVPFGRYKNPNYKDEENLSMVSKALQGQKIIHGDFEEILEHMEPQDFVYFDPPYHPISETSNFTSYTSNSFNAEDQKRLAACFKELDRRGCWVFLSNSDVDFIRNLYEGYNIETVSARRAINSKANKRGPVSELVIKNF